MKVILITQQHWTGLFNEEIKWKNYNLHVDDILSVTPKEIYVEDLTLLSHFEHDSKFLKALGSNIETKQGNIVTLQSPEEIDQAIKESPYDVKKKLQRENAYNNLSEYINKKARSYPENNHILIERDKQTKTIEKQNKMIKYFWLFMLLTFIVFSITYPQKSYELINYWLSNAVGLLKDITQLFFGRSLM